MKKYNILNNAIGWACFLIAAVTYLLTIEPTASFWDCPEFISQGAKLEVGHPPGNPIFMLAARFFVTLFGNNIANAAVAVNSMSALLSAGTILLLFWTITHLVKRLIVRDDAQQISPWKMALIFGGGICGALAYTWSDTFWFSAVEGEVYAFSSFCTALVFWLILKWENRADLPHSDRYLILIAYVIGVSIAVHLLNLLCIPAIVLVYYYRRHRNATAKGSLIALCLSFVIVGLILYGLVPGFVSVAQWFELFFVNWLGFSYNVGVSFYALILICSFLLAIFSLRKQTSAGAIKFWFFLSIALSGMLYIATWWIGLLLTVGLAAYLFIFCKAVPVRVFNVIILGTFLIFVGYSSYALLLIRSSANTPMNQNAPDNVFSLASYLNREQYGDRPLFYGAVFGEELPLIEYPENSGIYYVQFDEDGLPVTQNMDGVLRDENGSPYNSPESAYTKVVKTRAGQSDKYVKGAPRPNYEEIPGMKMLFPRIYSSDRRHIDWYKVWSDYSISDFENIPLNVRQKWADQGFAPWVEVAPYLSSLKQIATSIDHNGKDAGYAYVWKPGFMDNLRYFFNYQFAHMYWRYFMWNFAGRQNDIQGNGEPHLGNWISGIPFIDNLRLGDQSLLPSEYGKGNKGHNVFYMLPLLLGLIGLLWQALYIKRDAPQRGIEQFWVICFLFIMTGAAIVLYLNQTPYQPRERDYAFAGSFYAFAIWIGMGVPALGVMLRSIFAPRSKQPATPEKADGDATLPSQTAPIADSDSCPEQRSPRGALIASAVIAVAIGIFVPLQMVSQTWDDHDRSGRYTTRDFGFNYLSSVGPNGIIFCNGDNDTFPLWYAQEVEGYRTDVRVVNLSYLTTDWYANQQRIPSYDGAPIDMFATPSDYAYDYLAYSFLYPQTDSLTEAEQALRNLYASRNIYSTPILTETNIKMTVDTLAAMRAFAIEPADSARAALLLPYLEDITTDVSRLGRQGINLGNVLSLDIIANTVKNGFDRPVYFASTVPTEYYMGLTPFLASTGMAQQVTPFNSPSIDILADKSYENIVGKFKWGGLDGPNPERLYLDETVRRMVASTRSAIYSAAKNLILTGDMPASQWAVDYARQNGQKIPETRADMGRNLLEIITTKLPAAASPFDGILSVYMAEAYYDLYLQSHDPADLDAAEALLDQDIPRYAELMRYAQSLGQKVLSMGDSELQGLQYLGTAVALKNRIEVLRELEKDPVANAEIIARFAPRGTYDQTMRSIPLVYISGTNEAELARLIQNFEGTAYESVLTYARTLLDANRAAGIDPLALSRKLTDSYGFSDDDWFWLVQL